MPRPPRPSLRRAVAVAKLTVVVAVSSLALTGRLDTPAPDREHDVAEPGAVRADAPRARIDRLMERHECSHSGFGPDVVPGSALVRRGDRVRQVPFDQGWAVYTGAARGELIAVCRDEVRHRA